MFASLFSRGALSLAVVSLLTSSVAAEVLEKLSTVPQGWKYSHAPGDSDPIRLQIALQQQDVEGFEKALIEMSDPYHASYGKHFQSHDEMKRMLLPRQGAVESVRSWLEAGGVTDIQEDADWINFRTTVGVANTLLDADFKWYVSDVRSVERLRTLSYSIPDALVSHVHMIQPTTRFGQIQANRATFHSSSLHMDEKEILSAALQTGDSSTCDQVITPQCLKDLYKIGDYKADANSGSKVAFASYLEEYARYDDLAKFEEKLAPYAIGQNFSVIQYNGGLNDQNSASDSGEANLDLQYMLGISAPLPITEFSVGGRGKLVPDLSQPDPNDNSNEPYLEFLQNVLKMPQHELPQVISTSYGEDEQTIPKRYALSVCNLFAQLGSRGVSVIFSSGDSGVGAACATNDGRNTTHFPPQFPAACPWVTAVGGTTNTAPEKAVYFSSGGFSDLWPRPAWQEAAVSGYLKKLGGTYRGLYNPRGRAFPDVAAQAMKYAVFDKGVLHQYAGTSCSSPMFGGIIGLLNDARLRAHQPPLGFLNPWLYSKASRGFNDIVDGGSTGCDGNNRFGGSPNGSPVVPYASWNATAGWDPATGLGSPNFSKLLPLALRR